MKKDENYIKVIATNRRARYDYFIKEVIEAGIVLKGSEVKSLREGNASITEAYANCEGGELYLINAYIQEYKKASFFSHDPRIKRKLLLHKKQIKKLVGLIKTKGMTLVPINIYLNRRNIIKVGLGIAEGKKQYDKRECIKKDEWKLQKARLLKGELFT